MATGMNCDRLKVAFAGTPEFAAVALDALIASEHEVVVVLTQPDRPAGRGRKLARSSMIRYVLQLHTRSRTRRRRIPIRQRPRPMRPRPMRLRPTESPHPIPGEPPFAMGQM